MKDFDIRGYLLELDFKLSLIDEGQKECFFFEEIYKLNKSNLTDVIVLMLTDYCRVAVLNSSINIDELELSVNGVYEKIQESGMNLYNIYNISLDICVFNERALKQLEKINLPDWNKYNLLIDPKNKVNFINITDYYRYYLYNYFNPYTKNLIFLKDIEEKNPKFYEDIAMIIYSDYYRINKDFEQELNEDGYMDFKLNSKEELLKYLKYNDTLFEWLELVLNRYFYYNKNKLMEIEIPKWLEEESILCKMENKLYSKRKK